MSVDEARRRKVSPWRVAIAAVAVVTVGAVGFVLRPGGSDDGAAREREGRPGAELAAAEPVEVDCDAWDALAPDPVPGQAADLTPLPADATLRHGEFASGLRYYVRSNDRPGSSATLALTVEAGAALEDDDQHGAAHFLEHMLFNGTEGFPGNELPDALRELGIELGPDLNAYTSEDATVYYLDLPNDGKSIDRGLDVLLEWATRATIAPDHVEAERGVILEELRTGLGPEGRFFDRVRDLALDGTPYEGHEVIGTTESIEAMTADALRRFYEDWYRPDMMSVIAVGDFDTSAVEAEIRERFEPVASPASPREKPQLDSGRASVPRFASYLDDELAGTSAEVVFTRPSEPLATIDDLRRELVREVAVIALDQRLNDDAARGLVPFYEVDVEVYREVSEFESFLLSVDAEPEQLDDALESVVHELARARRHGLSDTEVSNAVAIRRTHSLTAEAGAATSQDRDLMFRFVDAALTNAPTTTSDVRALAELEILERVTAAEIADELRRITTCADMAVQAGLPGAYEEWLPDERRIADILASATSDELTPRDAEPGLPASIMVPPEPVTPVRRAEGALFSPAVFLEYPNGARVVINPSDIEAGQVTVAGESPGGLAEVDPADLPNARAAAELVSHSGVGDLDSVTLQRMLATKDAFAFTSIGPDTESVDAGGAATDLETILQLVHQRMTAPRIDDGAVATYRGENRLIAEDPSRRADTALLDAVDELLWQDDGRLRHLTTVADMEALDPARALALHRKRFGDVGDFVFVVVGDVDPAVTEDLVGRYIGALPSVGRVEDGTYSPPPPPTRIRSTTVEAGSAPQATIDVVFDVEVDVDPTVRDRAQVLRAVLDERLLDRLREELGATYVPIVSVDVDERTDRVRTSIEVGSDPERIDEVAREIQAEVDALRRDGPTDRQLRRAMEPILRDLQFIDHRLIVSTWTYSLRNPGRSLQDAPAAAELRLDGVDAAVVRELARLLLPAGAYVEVTQVPARR